MLAGRWGCLEGVRVGIMGEVMHRVLRMPFGSSYRLLVQSFVPSGCILTADWFNIRMIWRTFLHVGWLWLVLSVASAQLTAEQKTEILRLHNQYRSSVNPGASNMKRMLWDNTLSQVAVRYATTCRWEHNPLIKGILGENLFMALGPLIIRQPLELWYNEFNNYDFSNKNCASGKQCGHYTQMVWANTSFIGCASYFCSNVSNFDAQNATILVCNYFPA
ncbi:Peptidase inhibitor 16 [Bagarius yarrelli]|uniref:Peptidase inhibitor 16 n=1 Tax=Bagarius yarrelli TaxID=175774 RepID=A0A556U051_BAGYA|nr:Peptidase inhibitor 16 [Bagarius yarrelli]